MSLKDRYYAHILDHEAVTEEEKIVFTLMQDLKNRSGFDWGGLDKDIQEEWLQEWVDKVRSLTETREEKCQECKGSGRWGNPAIAQLPCKPCHSTGTITVTKTIAEIVEEWKGGGKCQ